MEENEARHEWKRPVPREHGPLDSRMIAGGHGIVLIELPSGARYHVREDGWRRIHKVVAVKAMKGTHKA